MASEPGNTSMEDFNYAKKAGLMFDKKLLRHDDVVPVALDEVKRMDKKSVTDLFLASLSTQALHWRIGLPSYALMRVFPKHIFSSSNLYCEVCSEVREGQEDLNFANKVRYNLGGICGGSLFDLYFNLCEHNKLPLQEPTEKDIVIFIKVLDIIRKAEIKEEKKDLIKKIRGIDGLKSTGEQRRAILETLGYYSILETEKHKGFLFQYTDLDMVETSKHSTDWAYPVDWWQVKDGINYEALRFWFGDYEEISNWIETNMR